MFGLKQKPKAKEKHNEAEEKPSKHIVKGVPRIVDFIANTIDRSNSEWFKVGKNYCKTLLVTGYPREVEIGWLNPLLEHQGDIDRIVHIEPYPDREALDELTRIYTRLETEESFVMKSGDNSMIQEVVTAKRDAWAIREAVATNRSRFYGVTVLANLYNKDLKVLEEECALLEGGLANRSIYSKFAEGRMDEGFISVSPLGVNLCEDVVRGFDSYALSTLFLFMVADLDHKYGIPIANNKYTGKFLKYDPRDPSLDNFNSAIFAGSGKGKSTLFKTFVSRMQFVGKGSTKGKYQGEKLVIIDPMSEYVDMTQKLDGIVIDVGPGSPHKLNPCDVSEEFDKELGEWVVNLGEKISAMTTLVSNMCGGLTDEEASLVDKCWKNVYMLPPYSFAENPESLYELKNEVDAAGKVKLGKVKKVMPRLRDFHAESQKIGQKLERVTIIMERYLESNPALGFFDCYTNVDLSEKRIYDFVVKRLEKNARAVGMHAIMSWVEDNFVKKDPNEPGRVGIDEAWLLARGEERVVKATMGFLESMYRRARHHKKGITIISQDFGVFARHEQGMAIFQNSDTMFFLNNTDAEIKSMGNELGFNEGILNQIRNAGRGEGIMKVKDTFYAFQVENTPLEQTWVYSSKPRTDEDEDEA